MKSHGFECWPVNQIKAVSGGWFTRECFICGVAFYGLFIHSNELYGTRLDLTRLEGDSCRNGNTRDAGTLEI